MPASVAFVIAAASVVVTPPPILADEIPPGTDIALRVDVAQLRQPSVDAWLDLKSILPFRPGLERVGAQLERRWFAFLDEVEHSTGADFARPKVIATVAIDIDAAGGEVLSAVIHDAFAAPPPTPIEAQINDALLEMGDGPVFERLTIDGVAAYRRGDIAWATIDGPHRNTVLVLGNVRGLQRQVRQLVSGKDNAADAPALASIARRLRKPAPVQMAFSLSRDAQRDLAAGMSDFAFLIEATTAGVLTARQAGFELQLDSADDDDREAVAHGLRAGVALVRSAVGLIEGSTELLLGLDAAGKRSALLPRGLDADALAPLLDQWVRDFVITAKVRKRTPNTTELVVELSSYQGLLTVASLLLANSSLATPSVAAEASALLFIMRRAQLLHKEINGEFVTCGPVPAQIPKAPTPWPASSCFDRLAFAPPKPVRVQLEASVDDGKLLLVARADPDGDGNPMVWYLDEASEQVRGTGATKPTQ